MLQCWACKGAVLGGSRGAKRVHQCQQCGTWNKTNNMIFPTPLSERGDICFKTQEPDAVEKELKRGMGRIKYSPQMLEDIQDKEEGWQDFLRKWDMWDDRMIERDAYLRYLRFKDVKFGDAPPEMHKQCFQDLLQIEAGLVFGDAIGEVEEFQFRFTVTDSTPIREKPIPYKREEREWIRKYIKNQCDLGILEEVLPGEEEPQFVVGCVLVRDGQSGQQHRLCVNLVQPNTRFIAAGAPLNDVQSTLDELQGTKIKSATDVKAGFFNVVLAPALRKYAGLVTQDGLFRFKRMAFGFANAPAMFQGVMNVAFSRARRNLTYGVYMDDGTVGGNDFGECWKDTLEAMVCILRQGMPINIRKCKFLTREIEVLGVVMSGDAYCLGPKAIGKLLASRIPRSLAELQSVAGKLNHCAPFVMDFKRKIRPIIEIMGGDGFGKWREPQTQALNSIAAMVAAQFRLQLVDKDRQLFIYVDCNETDISVVLAHSETEICGLAGRKLMAMEQRGSIIEKLLIAAVWGYKRFRRYCQYQAVTVLLPHPAELRTVQGSDSTAKIQQHLIELSSFQVTYGCGLGAWALQGDLREALETQAKSPVEEHRWTHEDVDIPAPQTRGNKRIEHPEFFMYFDGAFRKETGGAGGVLILDADREIIHAEGQFYGKNAGSNNEAEAMALVEGLNLVGEFLMKEGRGQDILVRGDSDLVIKFMNKVYKPHKKNLTNLVAAARETVKNLKGLKISFEHVPRRLNSWADFLSQVALKGADSVDLEEAKEMVAKGEVAVKLPEQDQLIGEVVMAGWDMSPAPPPRCYTCGEEGEEELDLLCHGCGEYFHRRCMAASYLPQRRGPWHCGPCLSALADKGTQDITLDDKLLKYLSHSERPPDPRDELRVQRASKFISMDQSGRLWYQDEKECPQRQIPPLYMRIRLIEVSFKQAGFPRGERLYQCLKEYWYWPGMKTDCCQHAALSVVRQKERGRYHPPPYLFPTSKGSRPFMVWSVDTAVKVGKPAPGGGENVVIGICVFSKWPEMGIIPTLNSACVAEWFYQEIICRYGCPKSVRTDQGSEYKGEFDSLLMHFGIQHRYIATMNPRANGQAERYVGIMKTTLRKLQLADPEGAWWDFIPEIARAIRTTPSATGISPYLLIFKHRPSIPLVEAMSWGEDVQDDEADEKSIWEATRSTDKLYEWVKARLSARDCKAVKAYLKKKNKAKVDVRIVFEPGMQVLLKAKLPWKNKCRSTGPYYFNEYVGRRGTNAIIETFAGKRYYVSAANLIPVYTLPPDNIRTHRFATKKKAVVPDSPMTWPSGGSDTG